MFDLPSVTSKDMKIANKWRKFLIKNGFIMLTESVYSRIALNNSVALSVKKTVKENLPSNGLIQLLEITERQYVEMEYLLGVPQDKVVSSSERYLEL